LLIKYYVTELLDLVIKTATKSWEKQDKALLCSKLQKKLCALESVGVTSDKYTTVFCLLIEFCKPEDVLSV